MQMMMKKIVVLIVCILFVLNVNSQSNKGYYNSKFYVTLDALVNSPIIYNFRTSSDLYSKFDKNLSIKSDKLNYGFRASVAVIMKRNLSFGIEGGIDYGNIYMNKSVSYSDSNSYYDLNVNMEKLDIQTFSFMPKIEFSIKNSLLPLGLSHQFGIGFNSTKLVERDYASNVYYEDFNNYYFQVPVTDFNQKFFDYKNQLATKTYTLLYALSMKTALTKNILLNYGFRYTFNIHGINLIGEVFDKTTNYYVSQSEISNLIYRQRFSNLINFNLGLTYAF